VGDLALPTSLIIFCIAWESFVLLIGGILGWNYFAGDLQLEHNANDLLYFVPLGMILFMVGLVWFGLWLSSFSEKKMLERVRLIVSGRMVGAQT
jgi:hypothetical protein